MRSRAYARNLFNTFRLNFLSNPPQATAHDPREVGLGLEMQF